jgi:hypothetical protein
MFLSWIAKQDDLKADLHGKEGKEQEEKQFEDYSRSLRTNLL